MYQNRFFRHIRERYWKMRNNLSWKAMVTREDDPMTVQRGSENSPIVVSTCPGAGFPPQVGWPLWRLLRGIRQDFCVSAQFRRI